MGTAAYMSPEQAAGEDVDPRSDLWSLGVVTREMLTGRPAFAAPNALAIIQAILTGTPEPIRSFRPEVAPELEEIVTRTMVRDRKSERSPPRGARSGVPTWQVAAGALRRRGPHRRHGARAACGRHPPRRWRYRLAGWATRNANVRWAREQALPEIIALAGTEVRRGLSSGPAGRAYIPGDPLLAEQLRAVLGTRRSIGAVWRGGPLPAVRPASDSWRPLGATPSRTPGPPRTAALEGAARRIRRGEDVGPGPFWPPRSASFSCRRARAGWHGPDCFVGQPFQIFLSGTRPSYRRSTFRTTGSISTRSPTAPSSGLSTTMAIAVRISGASRS